MSAQSESFSARTKAELVRLQNRHAGCEKAELAAAVQACGSLVIRRNTLILEMATENAALARRWFGFVKAYTGQTAQLLARQNNRLHKRSTVLLQIEGHETVLALLAQLGVWADGRILRTLPGFIRRTCCKRAYLRALFLACGSVTNPEKAYHLEWVFREMLLAQSTQALLATMNIDAQLIVRKQHVVVYVKDGDSISDILAGIGAHNAVFAWENARALHQVKNQVNRAVNCETANLKKTVNAAMRQVACIRYLAEHGILEKCPGPLREAADARLSEPDATLAELAAMMSEPTSKSGMNHRLRRLVELAQQAGYEESERKDKH